VAFAWLPDDRWVHRYLVFSADGRSSGEGVLRGSDRTGRLHPDGRRSAASGGRRRCGGRGLSVPRLPDGSAGIAFSRARRVRARSERTSRPAPRAPAGLRQAFEEQRAQHRGAVHTPQAPNRCPNPRHALSCPSLHHARPAGQRNDPDGLPHNIYQADSALYWTCQGDGVKVPFIPSSAWPGTSQR
jgi:hypothetical protein